ncbi:hypothetical protein BDY21DRAFT_353203 [Lineolata rhizophorae]|uniref:ER membrane protein complex subunit 7 beta-sandwich domain-containing protein n=1 Tax=Lineolata rhizophorae TaxID=578093 RepID=A0A6A6NTE8_9PEZI|nr:hypothetical protein BDY21DRAFT_353203 [Lineolata rhizophorae]
MRLPIRHSLVLLLSLATPLTHAARITFAVPSVSNLLDTPASLPPTTHATLHAFGDPLSAPLSRSGAFVFDDVKPGSYLLTVHCRDYAFEPLRVDVTGGAGKEGERQGGSEEMVSVWQTFRGNEWENKGERRGVGKGAGMGTVAEVRPVGRKEFYQERSGFSPLSFLKSPMILMALVTLLFVVGMPKLMENMDPETRAEFEEMQKKGPLGTGGGNPANQIQNFDLASWMAGKTEGGNGASGSTSGKGAGGGSGRRRG